MATRCFPHAMANHRRNPVDIQVALLEIVAILCLMLSWLACTGVSSSKSDSVFVSISPASSTVISSGTVQFSAMVGNTNNTTVTWSALPGSIDNTGLFTAPAVKANTTATVTATSVADPTQSASASVLVTPPAALAIVTSWMPDAVAGTPYDYSLTAVGGTPPYHWSLSSGNLPLGIQLNSFGSVSGTTTALGQFTFTVVVTDSSSSPAQTGTQSLTLSVDSSALVGAIPADFFNLHVTRPNTPWPSAPFAGKRLWDAGVSWSLVNTANGTYDWSLLDQRLADAQTHGVDVLYDMARTPVWAQCGPSTSSPCVQTSGCAYENATIGGGAGQCYWPADLNSDGTGTNQYWKNWVTAIATHSVNSSTAHIKYYEIWNEPNSSAYFRGTIAQLVRMTKDAACIIKGIGSGCTSQGIDPGAVIVTPAATQGALAINSFMDDFMALGGGSVVDVIAFHGYDGTDPGRVLDIVNTLKTGALTTYGKTNKPLFDTEFSWGLSVTFPDPDDRQGFVAQSLLLHWSSGVDRVYWYSWEASGVMWSATSITGCSTPDPSGVGYTCGTAIAFEQLQDWMVGAAMTPCTASGTVWTCNLTRLGGYQAVAVWDTGQSCSNGVCTTSKFNVPTEATYDHYRDLSGALHSVSGSTVPIGCKPILLENK